MIIATTPLAVLLVEMVAQSIWPGLTVNPVLAKSMLWWFGHPVVYLLLFPAVSRLLPPDARGTRSGRSSPATIVGIAWLIGVVRERDDRRAPHVPRLPEHVPADRQPGMQPLTYAIVTIPSALSLYSLGFTIYRSDFQWTTRR